MHSSKSLNDYEDHRSDDLVMGIDSREDYVRVGNPAFLALLFPWIFPTCQGHYGTIEAYGRCATVKITLFPNHTVDIQQQPSTIPRRICKSTIAQP